MVKNKNKNRFFLFCFSLIPGAGEMYLGFMRRGISLMCLFWGLIGLCAFFRIEPLLFTLPVLWFYSFFQTHNLVKLPDDDFQAYPDRFLFGLDSVNDLMALPGLTKRFHKLIAGALILLGFSILWNTFTGVVQNILSHLFPYREIYWLYDAIDQVPRVVAAILIILLGFTLIRGKKIALLPDKEATK